MAAAGALRGAPASITSTERRERASTSAPLRPALELLLPLARVYQAPLDELIGAPAADDPRVHALPFKRHGVTYQPLTRRPGGLQAYKLIIPAIRPHVEPDPQAHEGYEWL